MDLTVVAHFDVNVLIVSSVLLPTNAFKGSKPKKRLFRNHVLNPIIPDDIKSKYSQ